MSTEMNAPQETPNDELELTINVLKQRMAGHVSNYEEMIARLNVEVAKRDRTIAQLEAAAADHTHDEDEADDKPLKAVKKAK